MAATASALRHARADSRPEALAPALASVRFAAWPALAAVLLLAAGLRLWNLSAWPVFVDEDVYSWVAHLTLTLPFPQNLVQSVWVTKPPVPFLLVAALTRLVGDPLLAGRALSALSGVAATGLTYALARRVGSTRIALLAAGLYAITPGNLLAERMALQDAPAATCALAAVLLAWSAVERRSGWLAQAAALTGFLAVQLKLNSVALAALPLLLVLMLGSASRPSLSSLPAPVRLALARLVRVGRGLVSRRQRKLPHMSQPMPRAGGDKPRPYIGSQAPLALPSDSRQRQRWPIAVVAACGPLLSFAALMASPWGDALRIQNAEVYAPLTYLPANLAEVSASVGAYLPYWPLIGLGAGLLAVQRPRLLLFFAAAIAAWLLPVTLFSVGAHARYYLPAASPYLCTLAAIGLAWLIAKTGQGRSALVRRGGACPRPLAARAATRVMACASSGGGQAPALHAEHIVGGNARHSLLARAGTLAALALVALTLWRAALLVLAFQTAALSPPDDWQYRSGWPAGTPYQAARAYLAQLPPGTPILSAVDIGHRVGIGLLNVPAARVTEIDEFSYPLPPTAPGSVVVMDDGRDQDQQPSDQWLLRQAPQARLLAVFNRPGGRTGVRVYQLP